LQSEENGKKAEQTKRPNSKTTKQPNSQRAGLQTRQPAYKPVGFGSVLSQFNQFCIIEML